MSKAEAWEAWLKANGAFHTPYWKQTAQEKFNAGWEAGYAAAQADTEAKVRELDASAIVARVMQEGKAE